MRCICWRSQGKVFQTKKNASVRVRKDKFPKNYEQLLDGCIPADCPKDAQRLKQGIKERRKEGKDCWNLKTHIIYYYLYSGQSQRP